MLGGFEFEKAKDALASRLAAGMAGVLACPIVADLDTPVSVYLKLAANQKYSFLLESVTGGENRGRYSIIGLEPDLLFRIIESGAERAEGDLEKPTWQTIDTDPLIALRNLLADSAIDLPADMPAMSAGMVGYFGYDFIRLIEDLPSQNPEPYDMPTAFFVRPTLMAIFDSVLNVITLVTPVRPAVGIADNDLIAAAETRLMAYIRKLEQDLQRVVWDVEDINNSAQDVVSNTPARDYLQMVKDAQDYILAGDIFQVVLSQRFSQPFSLPPFSLFRALRRTNPSPYMYFLDFGDMSVVGSSPEILVALKDGEVTIRPIAGTRPRGSDAEDDQRLEADLLADQKELSEHLMLLDLGRNDVGRVAQEGSVSVTDKFFIERYSHVMHIVSNVTGKIREGKEAIDALAGGFPAGTVSGAPKVRAMEIIDELERDGRGLYAGAVGYFSADGSMDTAIVLRTAVIKDGVMHVQAGAGIVADSKPESEQAECEAKAGALFAAAREAVRFARDVSGNGAPL